MTVKIKKPSCESLLALYLCGFELLKPITTSFRHYSTIILLFYVLIMVALASVAISCRKCGRKLSYYFIFVAVSVLVYIIEFLFRSNNLLNEYMYYYAIYALVPLYLFVGVSNYSLFLKMYCRIACITGVLYLADPILRFRWSGDYMGFGFGIMLPAVICATVYWLYYQKKIFIPIIGIFSCELIICGNKGAIITAVIFIFYMYCCVVASKSKQFARIAVVVFAACLVVVFRIQIVDLFIGLSKKIYPISSYSLMSIKRMLMGQSGVYSGRLGIWQNAWECFTEKPIWGYGIGWYECEFENYTHNFFLDVLVSFGILGIILFICFFAISIKKFISIYNPETKLVSVILLIRWMIPLMFSLTFLHLTPFWLYFALQLTLPNHGVQKLLDFKEE